MYAHKRGRPYGAGEQAHDVLVHILRAKQQCLPDHSSGAARLAVPIGRRLGMDAEQLDELRRAASLHDIGKVGIPDAILSKPGPLDAEEWAFIRQHTVLCERILSAAPALRPVGQSSARATSAGTAKAIPTACAATRSSSRRASLRSATPMTRLSATAVIAPPGVRDRPVKSCDAKPATSSTP
jgi:hypothetical protein